ncbi:MAG: UPF0104 family protein [Acidobacteriales bacterium]|nr:MAG: UPF0104 family protein [Terriglobales bacterium]
MGSGGGGSSHRSAVSRLALALGYTFSIASLVWVYWGFDWSTELPKFAAVGWGWLALAVVSELVTYFCQGWRWSLLLRSVAAVSLFRSVQAIFVGLFANAVLPLRSGELIRAYLQARWAGIPFTVSLSSALIERLLDGILLVLSLYAVALAFPMPGYLGNASLVLALLVAVISILLAIVVFYKRRAHAAVSRSRWGEALQQAVEGLHAMSASRWFYASAAVSVLYLAVQLIPVYAVMKGLQLDLPLAAVAVVLVILRLGTALPQAPSNVGGFQFFTVVALRLFDVDKATATGFATVFFVVATLPLIAAGAIASAMAGIGIGDLRRHARAGFQPVKSPGAEA